MPKPAFGAGVSTTKTIIRAGRATKRRIQPRLVIAENRHSGARPDQVNAYYKGEKDPADHRRERQKVILKANDFVIEAEDPLSNETLRSFVRVRCVGSKFVSSHVIASPPPLSPTIYRTLPD